MRKPTVHFHLKGTSKYPLGPISQACTNWKDHPQMTTVSITVDSPSPSPIADIPYVGTLDFETRSTVLKALCNAAGIRLPDTRVPEGESLLPSGEENQRKLGADVKALPDLADTLTALRARVSAEKPKDVTVPIQRVRMDYHRAGLLGDGQEASKSIGYTKAGFGHVLSFVKPQSVRSGFGDTLLALPPKIRADAFNYFAETSHRPDVDQVVLRTHLAGVNYANPRRIIRAVTSDKYSAVDDLDVADAIQASIPKGAKLRLTRADDRTDFEVIWPALERQLKVGDIALISLRVVNSETKASAIKVMPQLLRVLCYNFTTAWSDGADEEISIRHIGEAKVKLAKAFERALSVVEPFVKAFGDAYAKDFPAFAPTRGELLARLAKKFMGILPSETVDLTGQLWDADGEKSAGNTLAGLVNAVTRASQMLNMEKSQSVEKVAGKLIANGWAALE